MGLFELPSTSKGVLITIGLLGALVYLFYGGVLLTVVVGIVFLALVLTLVYIIGTRLYRWALYTKPWRIGRGGST